MLRLRTTATLSLLALGVGIAGTQCLSDQTGSTAEPLTIRTPHHAMTHRVAVQHVAHQVRAISPHQAMGAQPHYVVARAAMPVVPVASRSDAIQWVPVSMPVSSIPFIRMRHHDVGSVVLHLVVDAQGQVTEATLAQSSGDDVLDANAMMIARRWRFAVPADHPQGFSGDLPLSFASASNQIAQTP
jgi:periplasmic protein TonB